MRRLTFLLVIFARAVIAGWATPAEPLMAVRSVVALSDSQASPHPPVAFEGTVLFFYRPGGSLYVQQDDAAISVRNARNVDLIPGDRVLVKGIAQPGLLVSVEATEIAVLGHGPLPAPFPASFDDLIRLPLEPRLVQVRGVIRTAGVTTLSKTPQGRMQLLMDGGYIDLEVQSGDESAIRKLLDAEVVVTGVAGKKYDGKMQEIGAKVKISSLSDIKVVKPSLTDPWSLPLTPLGKIITSYHVRDLTGRLRVHGAITYYQPGSAVVLQSGNESLWVSVQTSEPLRIGDVADAIGFPDISDGNLSLDRAEIRDLGTQAPIIPKETSWSELASWGKNRLGGHENDLVSIRGRMVSSVREASQDEYVLSSEGRLFTAIYVHPPISGQTPPMLRVPPGSEALVTGICTVTRNSSAQQEVPFNILLRSFDDIQVIARPSVLTIRNLIFVIAVLLAAVMAVGVRGWRLERKMRRQTAALAYQERRRSRILEDINGSRPLAEIIEQITEVVSARLNGAPSWCQITDGARLGNFPPSLDGLRVVEQIIPSRAGTVLGAMFAAFDQLTKPNQEEREALAMGAGLTALAIETRRLYTDLVHRSEFDLLTEVQNRFALEKHLDELIRTARETAGIFGLIYVDLDSFKQVNDLHGHQTGDLYLQQIADRLKRQLRPGDLLARLGGDEFGVLVPAVHSRTEVEEIAHRLRRCFREPFILEAHTIDGSASVGVAVYPEDGATRDQLLNAADAAMYAEKKTKKAFDTFVKSR